MWSFTTPAALELVHLPAVSQLHRRSARAERLHPDRGSVEPAVELSRLGGGLPPGLRSIGPGRRHTGLFVAGTRARGSARDVGHLLSVEADRRDRLPAGSAAAG